MNTIRGELLIQELIISGKISAFLYEVMKFSEAEKICGILNSGHLLRLLSVSKDS